MRPLDRLPSIKLKLGVAIVIALGVGLVASTAGSRLGVPFLLRGLIALSVALGMVQVLARGMISPLREMASAARAMARGEHGRRVRATSRDEVGELARAFNAMAADLDEVDRVRRDLVANVSHELRTPITALQAVLENLVDGVGTPDDDTFRTMLKQVERLGRLVSQLLDLSRLESGSVPLQRRAFPLRDVLDDAAEECRFNAPSVPVSVVVDPSDLAVDGDPERVHQVVANLLENAARHSPPGGSVEVTARGDGRLAVLEVADAGPGIPDDEAARVFERFYRSDAARASTDGGAGLGLAIARWIVDLHGGTIRPERRQPTGCRMVVALPQPVAPAATAPGATP
jgi:signal transduction histidine kinase